MTYRLFVAIEVPDAVRDRLAALKADVPGASWSKAASMHLTLRFLGDGLSDGQLTAVQRALERVHAAPFELMMSGVGRFPGGPRPARVLWVGVSESEPLLALQTQVETAVESAGFPREREYSPHVTLARLRQPKASAEVQSFLAAHAGFNSEPFPVDQFVLFSSALTPRGPIYTTQGLYPLLA